MHREVQNSQMHLSDLSLLSLMGLNLQFSFVLVGYCNSDCSAMYNKLGVYLINCWVACHYSWKCVESVAGSLVSSRVWEYSCEWVPDAQVLCARAVPLGQKNCLLVLHVAV